jgi:tripartite-type tricarboxylate transporter receptor subunit TctC
VDRRSFVAGSAAAAAALATRSAIAQEAYPARPVTFINPVPPGGAVDVVARPLAAVIEPILKQPVVIETKAGAAGQVGAQFAANAKPDGYILLMHIVSISGFAEVDKLFGRPVKFTRDDFIPIARFIADPMVLVVNDKQPYKTLKEFVDDAKKRPNELIFSSSGLYGALHLPTALFMRAAGIQMRHLPTAGGGPALTAILGNNSQVLVSSIAASNAQMKAGKLRPLACFGAQRAPVLPDVPTMKELGYDVEFYLWVGMFAPKGTPAPVITTLREASRKAAADDKFKQAMTNLGQDVAYLDQAEFKAFWDADAKRVEDAVRSIGKVEG